MKGLDEQSLSLYAWRATNHSTETAVLPKRL